MLLFYLIKEIITGVKLRNPCGKPGNISSVTDTPSNRSFLANITESSRHGSNSNVYKILFIYIIFFLLYSIKNLRFKNLQAF